MNRIQSTGTSGSRSSAFGAVQGEAQQQESDTLFEEFSTALKQVVRHLQNAHPELEVAPEVAVVKERPAGEKRGTVSSQQAFRDVGFVAEESPAADSNEIQNQSEDSDESNSSTLEEDSTEDQEASEGVLRTGSDELAQISEAAAAATSQTPKVSENKIENEAPSDAESDSSGSKDEALHVVGEEIDLTMGSDKATAEQLLNDGRLSDIKDELTSVDSESLVPQEGLTPDTQEGAGDGIPLEQSPSTAAPINSAGAAPKEASLATASALSADPQEEQIQDAAPAPQPETDTVLAPTATFAPAAPQETRAPIRKEASVLLNEISAALAAAMGDRSSPLSPRVTAEVSQMSKAVDSLGSAARNTSNVPSSQFGGLGLNEKAQSGEGLLRSQRTVARAAIARSLEKVEEVLKEAVRAKDGRSISVRLDPPELGSVKIDLTMREGGLHARLVSDSAQVSAVLRERAGDLHLILRKSGIEVDQITVIIRTAGDEDQLSFDAQYSQGQSGSWQFGEGEGEGRRSTSQSRSDSEVNGGKVIERTQDVLDHWVA